MQQKNACGGPDLYVCCVPEKCSLKGEEANGEGDDNDNVSDDDDDDDWWWCEFCQLAPSFQ